jgi:hypothetical protein
VRDKNETSDDHDRTDRSATHLRDPSLSIVLALGSAEKAIRCRARVTGGSTHQLPSVKSRSGPTARENRNELAVHDANAIVLGTGLEDRICNGRSINEGRAVE